jgi:hypothetical protein
MVKRLLFNKGKSKMKITLNKKYSNFGSLNIGDVFIDRAENICLKCFDGEYGDKNKKIHAINLTTSRIFTPSDSYEVIKLEAHLSCYDFFSKKDYN